MLDRLTMKCRKFSASFVQNKHTTKTRFTFKPQIFFFRCCYCTWQFFFLSSRPKPIFVLFSLRMFVDTHTRNIRVRYVWWIKIKKKKWKDANKARETRCFAQIEFVAIGRYCLCHASNKMLTRMIATQNRLYGRCLFKRNWQCRYLALEMGTVVNCLS